MTVLAERRVARARDVAASPPPPRRHSPGLDGLRGIAVLLVVAHHTVYRLGTPPWYARGGFLGVDLFFVLSGFLITSSLLDEGRRHGRIRLRLFYARRFLRLVPALALFAAAHVTYVALSHHGNLHRELAGWPWVFGYLANWRMAAGGAIGLGLFPLWSLAVEEQFYVVWPPLLTLVRRRSRATLGTLVVAGIAGSALLRAQLWSHTDPASFFSVYARTDARADALLVGVAFALLPAILRRRAGTLRRLAALAAVAFTVEVAYAVATAGWLYRGGFTLVALTAGVIVYAVATLDWGRGLLTRPLLVLVGRHSYAVYLWHAAVIEVTWIAGRSLPAGERVVVALAGTALVTALSYLLVERWCFRAMRRLSPRPPANEPSAGLGRLTGGQDVSTDARGGSRAPVGGARVTTLATAPAVRRPAVPAARRRRSALDGIRGCAVAGVLLAHLGIPHLHGGAIGVDVFFVLSGYLITRLLLDEASRRGRIDLRLFWQRRAARLLPALLLLIAVNTVWALTTRNHHGARESLHALPWVLGYAGNWVRAFSPHDLAVYGHTWSLALEEQFYLLWPIALVLWTRRRSTRALVPVLSAACVLGTLVRLVEWPGFAAVHRIYGTDYLADQVLLGCLLAVILHTGRRPALLVRLWSRRASAIGVVVLLATVVLLDPSRSSWEFAVFCTVGFTAVALASAAVIARVEVRHTGGLARALSIRPLTALGRISYGVYLLHIPVFAVVQERTHFSPPVRWAVELGLALLVATLSYRVLELPFLRIKERWVV